MQTTLPEQLAESLGSAGLRHRVAGPEMIAEMARSLEQLKQRGIMPGRVLDEYARSLTFVQPDGLGQVRSLIVVAAPSPAVKVVFDMGDESVEAVIPPTYIHTPIITRTLEVLAGTLGPAGFSAHKVALPAKMLAVRLGLARYGRNGLAYVDGLGSFVRLDVYATDADLSVPRDDDPPSIPEHLPVPPRMHRCMTCGCCYQLCPTRCISSTGDRIDPTRCLTFLNEREGEWPSHLDPRAHNSLVGCMICQRWCRENEEQGYVVPERLVEAFDREETAFILEGRPEEELTADMRRKLEGLDMLEYLPVLGRNLRALIGR